MKKFLSFAFAFILAFSSFLPLQVSAAEVDLSDYDQQIALAKQIFPEYSNKLDGNGTLQNIVPYAADSELNIVTRETRAINNNTIMTYTEYDSGVITLGTARFAPDLDFIIDDSVTHSTYEEFTASIYASVVEGPTFSATGIKYRLYPSDYDRVISAGSYDLYGYSDDSVEVYVRPLETSSLFACASYKFPCHVATMDYQGIIALQVSNNDASVEFDIW